MLMLKCRAMKRRLGVDHIPNPNPNPNPDSDPDANPNRDNNEITMGVSKSCEGKEGEKDSFANYTLMRQVLPVTVEGIENLCVDKVPALTLALTLILTLDPDT
jgi:hypothetical protein